MKQHYISANKALKLFSSQYLCWCLDYQWTLVWFGNLDTSAQRQHTGRQETAAHAPPHQSLEETRPMKPTICSAAQNGQEMQDPYNNTHAQGSCQQYVIVLLGLPDRLDQLFQYHYSSSWYFSLLFPLYLESSAKGRNFILFFFYLWKTKAESTAAGKISSLLKKQEWTLCLPDLVGISSHHQNVSRGQSMNQINYRACILIIG